MMVAGKHRRKRAADQLREIRQEIDNLQKACDLIDETSILRLRPILWNEIDRLRDEIEEVREWARR